MDIPSSRCSSTPGRRLPPGHQAARLLPRRTGLLLPLQHHLPRAAPLPRLQPSGRRPIRAPAGRRARSPPQRCLLQHHPQGRLRQGRVRGLLDEMLSRGIQPTVATFNTLVGTACQEGDPGAEQRLKDEMLRWGVASNAVTYALLMQGLCNAGRLDNARKLMFDMEYQGCQTEVANYGVLMSAHVARGDVDAVRGLLADMRRLKPNDASYKVLIKCLCEGGRVAEVHKALVEMQLKDGAVKSAYTYRVLADGMGSATKESDHHCPFLPEVDTGCISIRSTML